MTTTHAAVTPPSLNGALPTFIREEPPGYPPRKWAKLLAPLKAEPGVWYRILTATAKRAYGVAHTLRNSSALDGRFEFVARKIDDTTSGVWACYLGPNDEPAS